MPMLPQVRWAVLTGVCTAAAALSSGAPHAAIQPSSPDPRSRAAYLLVDLESGKALRRVGAQIRVAPGSIAKVATLIAALESGVAGATTSIACPGGATIGRERVLCVHPRFGRPLSPIEALAHSCNTFFATIGSRVPRDRLTRTFTMLGLAAPPSTVPVPFASIGLSAPEVSLDALATAIGRVVDPTNRLMSAATRALVLAGLRECARTGSASSFGARRIAAFAKTGTARRVDGGVNGVVVAAFPPERPRQALALALPGAAGKDAADLAAKLAAEWSSGRDTTAVAQRDVAERPTNAREELRIALGKLRRNTYDVEHVPLEEYVARVVTGEGGGVLPPAAEEALAIAARTFVLANRGRHEREGFDVCDLTHCQVARPPSDSGRAAARATSGVTLLFEQAPAPVFYTAWCGGRSEDVREVWPDPRRPEGLPFLRSRPDPYCPRGPQWRSDIPHHELLRALEAAGHRGDEIRSLRIARYTASGRVQRLKIQGVVPDEIDATAFRFAIGRVLGWNRLKSTSFDVRRIATGFRFSGTGSGHGVGLCLAGASAMARSGKSASEILHVYFPGLEAERDIGETARPPVMTEQPLRIELPYADEQWRADVTRAAEDALRRVRAKTGIGAAPAITIRFYPTTEAYRRATGRAWWTSAAADGSTIHMQPVSLLRTRGAVEKTLRHEIAHVLVDPVLHGRLLWVREGAAQHFGESSDAPAARASAVRGTCPADRDILAAPSAEAFKVAYEQALRCFQEELARGIPWQDVGKSR